MRYSRVTGRRRRLSKLIYPVAGVVLIAGLIIGSFNFWGEQAVAVYEDSETAVVKGDQLLGGGSDLNVATATALDWNLSQQFDNDYFSYAGGNSSRLVVDVAGDYYLSLTVPMTSSYTDTNERNSTNGYVYVNGSKQDVGIAASGYIRNGSNQDRSSIHLTAMLDGLSVNDYIEIFVQRDTTTTNNTVASDDHTLYVRNVDTPTVYSATGTRTTNSTNLNQSTAYEVEWSSDTRKDSGLSHNTGSASEDITLDNADNYLVSVNIPLNASITRANVIGKLLLDGTEISGTQFKQGYNRNADGHNWSSIHYTGAVTSGSASQVLSVSVEQEASGGTVTVGGEKATIYVERLPASGVYSGEATDLANGSTDWCPAVGSPVAASWETDNIIDTSVYTHDTGSNAENITVNDSGNYFVSINIPVSGNNTRITPGAYIAVNGTKVAGEEALTGYIRTSGHDESSLSITTMLPGVASGSTIEVFLEAVVDAGNPVTITDNAQLTIMKQSAEDDMVQVQGQWFRQNSTLTPNSEWTDSNEALVLTEDSRFYGDRPPLRLRLALATGTVPMQTGIDKLRLQYGQSQSGPWFDVGENITPEPNVFNEQYEGGTVGNSIGSSNSAYTNSATSGSATAEFSDTYSVSGSQSGEYDVGSSEYSTSTYLFGQNYDELYVRFYVRVSDNTPSGNVALMSVRDSTNSLNTDLQLRTDGLIAVRDSDFSAQDFSDSSIPANQWVRIEGWFDFANDEFEVRVYHSHNSSTITDTLSGTGANFATTTKDIWVGMRDTPTSALTMYMDDWAIDTDDWIGDIGDVVAPDWSFYDQAGLTDGATIPSTLLSGVDEPQSYAETNPTAVNPAAIAEGDTGEWDFSLDPTAATTDTLYYFRAVSDGGYDMTYNYYPTVKIALPTTGDFLRGGAYFNRSREQGFSF